MTCTVSECARAFAVLAMVSTAIVPISAATGTRRTAHRVTHRHVPKPAALKCGDITGFEILLDRQRFSPGEIDGTLGPNAKGALAAWQAAHQMKPTGTPDCDTWRALGAGGDQPLVQTYRIEAADVKGPFEKTIPDDAVQQAKLPALAYRSPVELLAEKFHESPKLLMSMNQGARFAEGEEIKVPAVTPFDASAKPRPPDVAETDVTITVSRHDSTLRVVGANNDLLLYAPVSSGSTHDPLPIGDWKVIGVNWMPVFHYNPKLFWDADPKTERATIRPGPNNPVGVVWIALNLEHYGLHGTPEPGHVGHTQSHGCVRLTNWDAARLAAIVKPGTPVMFRE